MPKHITQYDLLISCPGDVVDEIDIINEVVANFNQQFSNTLGLSIQTRHWSKSSYPQSGDKPQNLLNEQFVKDCDAAVAIFWTRFGTPTDNYKSGSEEEIDLMLKDGKQVFLYFCEKPVKPGYDNEQYQRVQAYKTKYASKGIYSVYSSNEEFKELFNAHLTQHFLTVKKLDAIRSETRPQLSLKSISEVGDIVDSAVVQKFMVPNPISDDERMESIKSKINLINKIDYLKNHPVMSSSVVSSINLGLSSILSVSSCPSSPINIKKSTKKKISEFAKLKGLSLNNNFFDLGELTEDIHAVILKLKGIDALHGNEDDKQKYQTICDLEKEIDDYILWDCIEKTFSDLYMMKLVVGNSGNTFDEDIDIEVYFSASMIKTHDNLPKLDRSNFELFDENSSFSDIFSIDKTERYADYYSSVKQENRSMSLMEPHFLEKSRQAENDYLNNLSQVFCYEIFKKDDNCIVKLHFDYIKQHTSIAFPTPLFVNTKCLTDKITYRIISKNNPDIVENELKIKMKENEQ